MTFGVKWLKNRRNAVVAIGVASFFASLVYSFAYRIPPVVDAYAYDVIAMNLLEGRGFREDATKRIEFDPAIVRAGPGYEYFLAGVYAVFGHRYEAIWILQALVHGLSAVFLFFICKRLFEERGERVGVIAAAIFGFSPDLIEISAMLMTETLYLFLVILTIAFFFKVFQDARAIQWTLATGAILGIAVLFRPPVLLFAAAILFFYAVRKAWLPAALFVFALAAVLAPWTIRNYQVYHQFIPTTLIGSYNLWLNNTADASGGQFNNEDFNPLSEYAATHGYAAVKQKATDEFLGFVRSHPASFIGLNVVRAVRYFSLIRPMGFWFYQSGIGQTLFVFMSGTWIAFLFVFGFSGLLQAFIEKRSLFRYLICFALVSPLVLIPTVVQSRYRFQIYPFLALFAAYFFSRIRADWSIVKRPFIIVASVLLVVTLVDISLSGAVILHRVRMLFS